MELWVCNDRNEIPSGTRLGYEVLVDGQVIIREMIDASIAVNAPMYQGNISFLLPKISHRATAVVRVGLFDANGNCLHQNSRSWSVLPAPSTPKKAGFAFSEDPAAGALLKEINMT